MSIKVMNWAWTICLPPAPKLVLMALADIADDTGFCFPSVSTLAAKVSMDQRSVQRILRKLTADFFVSIEQRFRENRTQTSNGYRLAVDRPPAICHPPPDSSVTGGVTSVPGGGWHSCHREGDIGAGVTSTEPTIYPSQQPPREVEPAWGADAAPDEDVGRRDYCFPKGVSLDQQRGLREQLVGLEHDKAQQLLDELAGRMVKTQVRNPVRYCAKLVERAKRGHFQPELAFIVAKRRQIEQRRTASAVERGSASEVAADVRRRALPESIGSLLKRACPTPPGESKGGESGSNPRT